MSYSDGPRRGWQRPKPTTDKTPQAATKSVTATMTDDEFLAALAKRDGERRAHTAEPPTRPPAQLHPFALKFGILIGRMWANNDREIKLRDVVSDLALMGGDPKAEGWYEVVKDIGVHDFGLREVKANAFPTVWEMPQVLPVVENGAVVLKAKYDKPLPGRILEDGFAVPGDVQ